MVDKSEELCQIEVSVEKIIEVIRKVVANCQDQVVSNLRVPRVLKCSWNQPL